MTFGERLKDARKQKKMTQAELAEKIGVASTTMAGYENGNREPDVFKIKRLIEILEIDSDYLLDINTEKNVTDEEIDSDVDKMFEVLKDKFDNVPEQKLHLIIRIAKDILDSDI